MGGGGTCHMALMRRATASPSAPWPVWLLLLRQPSFQPGPACLPEASGPRPRLRRCSSATTMPAHHCPCAALSLTCRRCCSSSPACPWCSAAAKDTTSARVAVLDPKAGLERGQQQAGGAVSKGAANWYSFKINCYCSSGCTYNIVYVDRNGYTRASNQAISRNRAHTWQVSTVSTACLAPTLPCAAASSHQHAHPERRGTRSALLCRRLHPPPRPPPCPADTAHLPPPHPSPPQRYLVKVNGGTFDPRWTSSVRFC